MTLEVNMPTVRFGIMKFRGGDVTVLGDDLKIGDRAPDFGVHTQDWTVFRGITDTAGKVRIIAAVPSVDTDVCDRETRRFNLEAASLGDEVVILVVSTDLPYAQKRWCGSAGIDQVKVVSDHLSGEFGLGYGCLLKEVRVLRRAVFVVDRNDKIVYVAYMPALGIEPDYTQVIDAVKNALR
jgi:thioredoxin-dependent peroxiredoxin